MTAAFVSIRLGAIGKETVRFSTDDDVPQICIETPSFRIVMTVEHMRDPTPEEVAAMQHLAETTRSFSKHVERISRGEAK